MENKKLLNYSIKPIWDNIDEISEKISSILQGYNSVLIVTTIHIATELIENAVKFGSYVQDEGINFTLTANESQIQIEIVNKICNQEDYNSLKKIIDQIEFADDPMQLYTNRLLTLLNDISIGKSQLGLFRIAAEGNFTLGHHLENNILTVTATKNI